MTSRSEELPGPKADTADLSTALERVVRSFEGLVRKTAHRHGLSDAEQDAALQDVRIRLWQALGDSENIRSAPASYIYRTALSAVVDYIRRRRARREDHLEDMDETAAPAVRHGDEADAITQQGDVESAIERALQTLPQTRQAVVRLHLAGYDRFEIADLLGWSEAKTRNLLYRGLETMRQELRRMGFGPGSQP
jgi:RNA polymerase sigma-70 factor (ECF subfamily)